MNIYDFPGSGEMTFADPERLMQVFRNVLDQCHQVHARWRAHHRSTGRKLPGFIEVVIRDTGIGIDPEDQSIIFEKFTRLGNISLHSSGKTKFKGGGPGLGLHIARGIIEAHGGAIWVESPGYDEDRPSRVHLPHPAAAAISEPPDAQMASPALALTYQTILLRKTQDE